MTKRDRAGQLVQTLQRNGHLAFFVGGSVRDLLLGRKPKDYDIVTGAFPEEIAALFPRHLSVGKRFGVVMVVAPEGRFEVATFRREVDYIDRRRPEQVEWTDAKTDVLRRDFTINGLLYDPVSQEVIDYVEGNRDLKLRIVRTIGDPSERLHEDPLRILRAVRLKNQLGFQYDKATYDAVRLLASELHHVSPERIRDELNGMLEGSWRRRALNDLNDLALLAVILPELEALKGTPQPYQYHQEGDVFDHSLAAVNSLETHAPLFLVWATLLHDVGKPGTLRYETGQRIATPDHAQVSARIAEMILHRFRFPKTETDTIVWLIAHHMSLAKIEAMRPARREAYVLDPRFPWLLELHRADASGTIPRDLSLYAHDLKLYETMRAAHEKAKITSPPLLIDGHGLQEELNLEPGRVIGELLEVIRDEQLAGLIHTRSEAVQLARRQLGSFG